jgi:hypothetical protein
MSIEVCLVIGNLTIASEIQLDHQLKFIWFFGEFIITNEIQLVVGHDIIICLCVRNYK